MASEHLNGSLAFATLLLVGVLMQGCNDKKGDSFLGGDKNSTDKTLAPSPAPTLAPQPATPMPTPESASKRCVVMGSVIKHWPDCTQVATSAGNEVANANGGEFNWACALPDDRYAITDGKNNKLLIWNAKTYSMSTPTSLGNLKVPVGCTYMDGKIYVAGFGSWPNPNGDSGLAVVDAASGRFESYHAYSLDGMSHVHNVYAFEWNGGKEIFVAAMGNPWSGVVGQGIVRFDRGANSYDSSTATVSLNCRSAVQEGSDAWYILTQEPSSQRTKLARLEKSGQGFSKVAEELLPARGDGGDGGADVFLSAVPGVVFVTDRSGSGGKLYAYRYSSGSFSKQSEHSTGNHPRHSTMTTSGDVISVNQKGNDVSRFPGLGTNPSRQVQPQKSNYVMNSPFFIMDGI